MIARVKEADAAGAEAAIAASNEAFRAWRKLPAPRRGELVRLLGEELRAAKTANIDKKPAYDYDDHARNSTGHSAYVSDEMADSFTIARRGRKTFR